MGIVNCTTSPKFVNVTFRFIIILAVSRGCGAYSIYRSILKFGYFFSTQENIPFPLRVVGNTLSVGWRQIINYRLDVLLPFLFNLAFLFFEFLDMLNSDRS